MSLKQEIQTWVDALAYYDASDYDAALSTFDKICDTSKIFFNCGVIHATLGQHRRAIEYFREAVQLDQFLAVAYFQQGVSSFLCSDFEEALANFNDALYYLRGNRYINYEQLGLNFMLHYCEVMFNRGLCFFRTQQRDAGMHDLVLASSEKAVQDHNVIDEAIRDHAEGYTVFSIPVGVLYRPNEAKVRNLASRIYLPKPQLVAQQHRRQLSAQDVPQTEKLLDKSPSVGRARQDSEPPRHRTPFPPTPPPDSEKPFFPNSTRLQALHSRLKIDTKNLFPRSKASRRVDSAQVQSDKLQTALSEPSPPTSKVRSARRAAVIYDGSPGSLRSMYSAFMNRHSHTPTVLINDRPPSGDEKHKSEVIDEQHIASPAESTKSSSPGSHRGRKGSATSQPIRVRQGSSSTSVCSPSTSVGAGGSLPRRRRLDAKEHQLLEACARPSTPALKYLKIKLHTATDDLRFLKLEADITFKAASEIVRTKLGVDRDASMKIRLCDDEGDMVTLGDEEDWTLAVEVAKKAAREEWRRRRDRSEDGELGKLDLWISVIVQ